jgi:4-amino-4-deoxy-L-arabinose transferase-like glycosyltransferase
VKNTVVRDLLLVAVLGATVLVFAYVTGCPGLVWSDEVIYAVVGRNIEQGRGPLSNFYHPAAIVAEGFPLRDVHLPLHAYLLGLSFTVFGVREWAALVPNQMSFVLAGLVLFDVARRAVGRRAAFGAAALFYLFPPQATLAHSAMSETTLVLLTVVAIWLWYRCRERPRVALAALLGVLLAVGATHRETFLVLLIPALHALWRWPPPQRARAAAAFAGAFLVGMAVVFWPQHLARSRIPHTGFETLALAGQPGWLWAILREAATAKLGALSLFGPEAWRHVHALQVLTVLGAAVVGLRTTGARRELAGVAAWSYVATFSVMLPLYPLSDWRAVRQFMFAVPAAIIVISSAIPALAASRARVVAWAAVPVFLFAAAEAHATLTRSRQAALAAQTEYSRYLADALRPYQPQLVIAPAAYRYGWDMYPVSVVVSDATELVNTKAVDNVVRVDAIVVEKEKRRSFLGKIERGAYRGRYRELPPRFGTRYVVFVNHSG